MPVDLVLVRHGESESNISKVRGVDRSGLTGEFADRHTSRYRLTDIGRKQAKAVGDFLQREFVDGFDVHYTSEYVRACETAACLELGEQVSWEMSYYLRDKDGGIFSGKPGPVAMEGKYDEKLRRERDCYYYCPPGGESVASCCQRVDMFLSELAEQCSGLRVLAVVHHNIVYAFRICVENIPQLSFEQVFHSPTGRVSNGQVIHYSRRNPFTREVSQHFTWMRITVPWKGVDRGWQPIFRPRFTNEEMLGLIADIPQLLNNTPEELADDHVGRKRTVDDLMASH